MIVIVDYNAGNIGSVKNMLDLLNVESVVSSDVSVLSNAKKIILPGVGSFDHGMKNLINLNLVETIRRLVLVDKIPVLGICLGAQLLTKKSEEGSYEGLGLLSAQTYKFPTSELKLPHIGWNKVQLSNCELFKNLGSSARFYFVHNYYMKSHDDLSETFKTSYIIEFDSAIVKENIYAVQFHPEKSHKYGMQLFKNFCAL